MVLREGSRGVIAWEATILPLLPPHPLEALEVLMVVEGVEVRATILFFPLLEDLLIKIGTQAMETEEEVEGQRILATLATSWNLIKTNRINFVPSS